MTSGCILGHRAAKAIGSASPSGGGASSLPVLARKEIHALRERDAVSQPMFAAYLNVSRNLVSDWERGRRRPGGQAPRRLSIVQRSGLAAIA